MSASIAPTKAAKVPESGAADAPDATETAQTWTEKAAPASVAQNGAERDELAAALVRQICISTELRRERDEARAAVSRLNRRVQVAESAIAELTGTGEGKASQVSREIWTRCEESHGLLVSDPADGLTAIASIEPTGAHISISAPGRYPTWDEIASIKERVFPDLPMVMALPPRAEHVNVHATCLHIWEANT